VFLKIWLAITNCNTAEGASLHQHQQKQNFLTTYHTGNSSRRNIFLVTGEPPILK